jgi:hypothetical protein
MSATERAVDLVHRDGRMHDQVMERVTTPRVAGFGQSALAPQVGALLGRRAMTGAVVLVNASWADEQQVSAPERPAVTIAEHTLWLHSNAQDLVEASQQCLSGRLGALIGDQVRRTKGTSPGASALKKGLHPQRVDVTERSSRVDEHDQIEMPEVPRGPQQNLLGIVDGKAVRTRAALSGLVRVDEP